MKQRELITFCRQLAQIAAAGMGFEEGIQLIADEGKEKYIQRGRMVSKLSEGISLVQVLEEEELFSKEMLQMIAVGMETGNLEEVFTELANYYERENSIKDQIKTAFYYPLILGSMLLVVMSILIIKVLPIFKEVFEGMGIAATGFTKWLFEAGSFIGALMMVILAVGWLLIFIGNFCAHFKQTQKLWKRLTTRSRLLETVDLIRVTSMLSLLVKSGEDLESALLHGEELARQESVKQKVQCCREELIATADLMEALNKSDLFHPFLRKSLVLALKTGSLEESLKEASSYYEEHLEKSLVRRLSIIEPISVGMISLMIGSVLLAVMFPLMNLMNTLS